MGYIFFFFTISASASFNVALSQSVSLALALSLSIFLSLSLNLSLSLLREPPCQSVCFLACVSVCLVINLIVLYSRLGWHTDCPHKKHIPQPLIYIYTPVQRTSGSSWACGHNTEREPHQSPPLQPTERERQRERAREG